MRKLAVAAATRPSFDSVIGDRHRHEDWSSVAPKGDFVSAVDRIIGLLGKQRFMRLTLFRIQLEGLPQSAAVTMVSRALKTQGIVGTLPDGGVGFLFLGLRGKGMVADLALVHHIRQQLHDEIHRQSLFSPLRLSSLSVAHCWADEMVDAQDFLDVLQQPHLESLRAC